MVRIPLIPPYFADDAKAKISAVLDSGCVTEGLVTREEERAFCDVTRRPHAIRVTSHTAGPTMTPCCPEIGLGDRVIVSDYTYRATRNARRGLARGIRAAARSALVAHSRGCAMPTSRREAGLTGLCDD